MFNNNKLFNKSIIAMLHLKGDSVEDMMRRAKQEIKIYYENGVDAVLVENYFGSSADCDTVLDYLHANYPDKLYGVNILGDYKTAFMLAKKYDADFIQIDSVCGHLVQQSDAEYGEVLKNLRTEFGITVLGGVRFKYQPVLSGRSLQQDLMFGMERCDAIVVTGEGTGADSPNEKILEFRNQIGSFPLIVGAGVTIDTVEQKLAMADGVIIGSWLKENHRDHGEVSEKYLKEFMKTVISVKGS